MKRGPTFTVNAGFRTLFSLYPPPSASIHASRSMESTSSPYDNDEKAIPLPQPGVHSPPRLREAPARFQPFAMPSSPMTAYPPGLSHSRMGPISQVRWERSGWSCQIFTDLILNLSVSPCRSLAVEGGGKAAILCFFFESRPPFGCRQIVAAQTKSVLFFISSFQVPSSPPPSKFLAVPV